MVETGEGSTAVEEKRQEAEEEAEDEGKKKPDFFAVCSDLGSRKRKSVQILQYEDHREAKPVVVKEGKGVPLSDIEPVTENLKGVPSKDPILKSLHSLAYNRVGKATEVKGNLLKFSGLVYEGGNTRKKVEAKAAKWSLAELKNGIDVLGIDRSSASFDDGKISKEGLVKRLVDFLEEPSDEKVKTKKTKKSSSSSIRKSPTKKSPAKKNKAASKRKDSEDGGSKKKKVENKKKSSVAKKKKKFSGSENMLKKRKSGGGEEEEDDDEKPKAKKRKASPVKKQTKKAKVEKDEEDDEEEEEEEEEEEDEAPVADEEEEGEEEEKEESLDKELIEKIDKMMEESDMTTLTMKQMISKLQGQVDYELVAKKALIKDYIREKMGS